MDYDGTVRHRYITFPTADSREVNLTCPIRPGALSDSYSVQWESSIPGVDGFTIVDTGHYDITEDIDPTSRHQYQCKVSIQHRNDQTGTETYDGPMIVLNKTGNIVPCSRSENYPIVVYMYFLIAVLGTIENDIQNVSVLEEETAMFACEFSKGNISDIDINWSVGDMIFNDCDSTEDDIAPNGNGCYTNGTHSVLVMNTLDPGSYQVQCILQQNIPEEFKNDPSFQENFNSITRSSSLTIKSKSKLFPNNCRNSIDLCCVLIQNPSWMSSILMSTTTVW